MDFIAYFCFTRLGKKAVVGYDKHLTFNLCVRNTIKMGGLKR